MPRREYVGGARKESGNQLLEMKNQWRCKIPVQPHIRAIDLSRRLSKTHTGPPEGGRYVQVVGVCASGDPLGSYAANT